MDADNQQPKAEDLGWLAGIIDGEGWVGFSSVNRGTHQQYKPNIEIVGTHKAGLENTDRILTQLHAGHYVYWRDPSPSSLGKKRVWRIQIHGMKRVANVIAIIKDFLVIKRAQAQVLQDWIDLRQSKLVHSSITADELQLIAAIRDLNSGRLNDYTPDIVSRQIGNGTSGDTQCPTCKAYFAQSRSDQVYCTKRCRDRAAMRRSRERAA